MATHTVADDVLYSREAELYFVGADRRVMIGLRATLELLGLPLPDYAQRKPPGPRTASAKVIAAMYAADNRQPKPRKVYHYDPNKFREKRAQR